MLVSMYLFRIAAGSISLLHLNTVSYVMYFQLFLMAVVGSVLVATKKVDYHYMIAPVSDAVKVYAWVGVMYSIIAMPLGMILLNNMLKIRNIREKLKDYVRKPIKCDFGSKSQNNILLILTIFSTLVLVYVLTSNDIIPIFELIKGNKKVAAVGRILVRREFGGIEYIKNLLGLILIPIFAYFSYIIWQRNKSFIRFVFMLILNFNAILLLIYDTQKAPFVFFLMGYIIILTMVKNGVSLFKFIFFIISALLLVSLGYYMTGERGIDQLLDPTSALYGRIFISGYGGYVLSLHFFHDIIKDSTIFIGIPHAILDFFHLPSTESARLLMQQINPEGVKAGTANLISSYYLGEAYANYGILGIVFSPFIVGFIVQSLHIILLQSRKYPLWIAFYAFITQRWLLNAGFVNFLYLKIILYPLLIVFLVKVFFNTMKKWNQEKKS